MLGLTPFERRSYDLFNAFHDFENDFFNGGATPVSGCKTDIVEQDDKYVLETELPGFDKEDIKLDINDGLLTLSAERKDEKDEQDQKGKYIRRERSYCSYKRSFDVSNVNTDNIDVEYKNGVLTVTLPKKEIVTPEPKRLEIR